MISEDRITLDIDKPEIRKAFDEVYQDDPELVMKIVASAYDNNVLCWKRLTGTYEAHELSTLLQTLLGSIMLKLKPGRIVADMKRSGTWPSDST